jgi:archaellin
MANLSKGDIKKRNNVEVLADKFFGLNGYENRFVGPDGVFIPHALVVETPAGEYAWETTDDKQKESAISRILEFLDDRSAKLFFTGKYENTGAIKTVTLTDLQKTVEFGGQSGKGAKINLGIQFEKDLFSSLVDYYETGKLTGKYGEQAKKIVTELGQKYKKPLSEVIAVGELNQKRPLSISGSSLRLGNGSIDIGNTVTDITLKFGDTEAYLSLKYGSTLAFANIGVGTLFKQTEMKQYKLNTNAQTVLKLFGLSTTSFCDAFNNYPHSGKIPNYEVDVTNTCNKKEMENLLKQMIGKGYTMVHGTGSKIAVYDIDDSYLRSAASLTGKITVYYGGTTGKGKKVIVSCESAKYKFQFNIRNKQSGVYPSHIMCDYQKK